VSRGRPVEKPRLLKRPHLCTDCGKWHYPGRTQTDVDPALGDKVPRCRTCGSPHDVLELTLVHGGKPVGRYRLCGACYYAANPIDPQAGDPLAA
jgi:hypothetical protein